MADGDITIGIDSALADRLKAAAEASGETFDDYVRHALEAFSDVAADWAEDFARIREFEETGASVPAAEALDRFRTDVDARLDKRR
jgi:hypothetical protein